MLKTLFIILSLVTIQNKQAKLSVESVNGKIMEYVVGGRNYMPSGGSATVPWAFTAIGPKGERPSIMPGRASYTFAQLDPNNMDRIILEWKMMFGYEMSYSIYVYIFMPRTGFPQWDIEINMPAGWKVSNLVFPDISFAAEQNSCVFSPAFLGESRQMNYNSAFNRYPSMYSNMNFVMAQAPGNATFFVSTMESSGDAKVYSVVRNGEKTRFSITVPTSYSWTNADGVFKSPWSTEIGIYPGDWQKTLLDCYLAKNERAGLVKYGARDRKTPEWVKENDIWFECDGSQESIDAVLKARARLHCGNVLLSKADAQAVKKLQSAGCKVIVGTECTYWNSGEESFALRNGAKAMAKQQAGTFYSEYTPEGYFLNLACPSSPIWKERIKDKWAEAANCGADGVSAGNLIASRPEPCYDPEHSHPAGGGSWWTKSVETIIKENKPSGLAFCCNEFNEQMMDEFDICFVRNATRTAGVTQIPLLPLLYSNKMIYAGFTADPVSYSDGGLRFSMMKSLLWGSQLLIARPGLLLENASETTLAENILKFRSEAHDIFVGGRFVNEFCADGDNPWLDIPSYGKNKAVCGSHWKNAKGKLATIVVNMDTKAHNVTVNGLSVKMEALSIVRL